MQRNGSINKEGQFTAVYGAVDALQILIEAYGQQHFRISFYYSHQHHRKPKPTHVVLWMLSVNIWQLLIHRLFTNGVTQVISSQDFYKTRQNNKVLLGEEAPHLVSSCSSQHWRKKRDIVVPGTPVAPWRSTISSAADPQTAYWPAAPLGSSESAVGKQTRPKFTRWSGYFLQLMIRPEEYSENMNLSTWKLRMLLTVFVEVPSEKGDLP